MAHLLPERDSSTHSSHAHAAGMDSSHERSARPTLERTVALVTGASSGIGEAVARGLAREGATVAILARRRDRLERIAESIGRDGGTALVLEADVTDQSSASMAVERAVEQLGRLDTVVNN